MGCKEKDKDKLLSLSLSLSLSLFVTICAATVCFVFWCGFLLQSKETSLFLKWKCRIWCKLGREEGWVYLERRPRTGFLSCFSASCILSLVLVVRESLALANLSMSSFFEGFSCWKKGRKKETKNPKPKTPKNQQKTEKLTQQQKKIPTHKDNLACHQKSELQNKPRKTKIQQWVVSKGRIEAMVQRP